MSVLRRTARRLRRPALWGLDTPWEYSASRATPQAARPTGTVASAPASRGHEPTSTPAPRLDRGPHALSAGGLRPGVSYRHGRRRRRGRAPAPVVGGRRRSAGARRGRPRPVDPATPSIEVPVPGQLNPVPVNVWKMEPAVNGRHVTVLLAWWSGIAPCSVLDSVEVIRDGTTISLTPREGSDPKAAGGAGRLPRDRDAPRNDRRPRRARARDLDPRPERRPRARRDHDRVDARVPAQPAPVDESRSPRPSRASCATIPA